MRLPPGKADTTSTQPQTEIPTSTQDDTPASTGTLQDGVTSTTAPSPSSTPAPTVPATTTPAPTAPATTIIIIETPSPTPTDSASQSNGAHVNVGGAIAGAVIGALVLSILIRVGWWWYKRKERRRWSLEVVTPVVQRRRGPRREEEETQDDSSEQDERSTFLEPRIRKYHNDARVPTTTAGPSSFKPLRNTDYSYPRTVTSTAASWMTPVEWRSDREEAPLPGPSRRTEQAIPGPSNRPFSLDQTDYDSTSADESRVSTTWSTSTAQTYLPTRPNRPYGRKPYRGRSRDYLRTATRNASLRGQPEEGLEDGSVAGPSRSNKPTKLYIPQGRPFDYLSPPASSTPWSGRNQGLRHQPSMMGGPPTLEDIPEQSTEPSQRGSQRSSDPSGTVASRNRGSVDTDPTNVDTLPTTVEPSPIDFKSPMKGLPFPMSPPSRKVSFTTLGRSQPINAPVSLPPLAPETPFVPNEPASLAPPVPPKDDVLSVPQAVSQELAVEEKTPRPRFPSFKLDLPFIPSISPITTQLFIPDMPSPSVSATYQDVT